MAKRRDDEPRKLFSKSGHTSHGSSGTRPAARPAVPAPPAGPVAPVQPPRYPPIGNTPGGYPPPGYPPLGQPGYPPLGQPGYPTAAGYAGFPPGGYPVSSHHATPVDDGFSPPTYHHTPAAAWAAQHPGHDEQNRTPHRPAVALALGAAAHTQHAARVITKKVISASKADGANESGLTALIWNQVLSYGTDAMITVALAGTVFFGASMNAQRGNILLYLLITMAPFAVVAPVIGPVLDRLQHGRRWTMAGTAIGRAVLALIMANHPTELLVLYPCALGSLVLSKAYGVVRAAATPRLVPPGMTLTEANARLSIFGLGSTLIFGGTIGIIIKVTGSYGAGLMITAIAFAACGVFAFRLPPQVDSAHAAPPHPQEPPPPSSRPQTQAKVPPMRRLRTWAGNGFDQSLVISVQGLCAQRLLSGLLTIYLAFYVESTAHGLQAALELGAVVFAAGFGNFVGTAIGTKTKMRQPASLIVLSVTVAAAFCVLAVVIFGMTFAVLAMFVSAVTNSLAKIALDALIQQDVDETLRSSAFARAETFLQLAWVIGATIAVGLPNDTAIGGALGFLVAAIIVGSTAVVLFLHDRVITRATSAHKGNGRPGTVGLHKSNQS